MKCKVIDNEVYERVEVFRDDQFQFELIEETEYVRNWLYNTEKGKFVLSHGYDIQHDSYHQRQSYRMKLRIIAYLKPKDITYMALKFN